MCGIAGFCLNPSERIDAKELSIALLQKIQSRGTDATGAAWVRAGNGTRPTDIMVSKAPVAASRFEPYLESMSPKVKTAILHTRYATQGHQSNNLNNHPVVHERIIGVHNGHISNDRAVFAHFSAAERRAQVDSEAAFALLNHTKHAPQDVLASLQGGVALAWLNADDKRDLHLARLRNSPLAIGGTSENSIIFASTLPLLISACSVAGVKLAWSQEVDEGTYLRYRRGQLEELEAIGESLKDIQPVSWGNVRQASVR